MSQIVELIGKLFFDETWKFFGLQDGIEIWKNIHHGWVNHVVRATGEVIELD